MTAPPSEPPVTARFRQAPTKYEPVERIAVGGMAEVWRALATLEGSDRVYPVAIKRVLPALENETLYRSMFEDEARLGMLLRHPNIVRVYDARDISGTFIMVMELVDGASLRDLLWRAQERNACMPVPVALHIARQTAAALAYAHAAATESGEPLGIVHRDVSPHNVLLGRDGSVKLADFGLADAAVHETATDLVGGKFCYMAPELVRRNPGDHRVDLFALGIVLWEMLAGRRLFQRETDAQTIQAVGRCEVSPLRDHNAKVSPAVDQLVDELLLSNPEERISSADEVLRRLDDLIRAVDAEVGRRDVALLVGLHLASIRTKKTEDIKPDMANLLAQELDQFAQAAAGQKYDIGAAPLDPSEFGNLGTGIAR